MNADRGAARDLRARDRGPAERPPHRQRGAPGPRRDRGERRADDELGRALVQGAHRERRRADPLPVGRREDAALQVRRDRSSPRPRRSRSSETFPTGGGAAAATDRPPPRPAEPPTPKVGKGGDLSAQMLDQYRKDRGVGADVDADGRPQGAGRGRRAARARRAHRARHRRLRPGLQGRDRRTRSSRCSSSPTRATSRTSPRATSRATARRTSSCAACATRRATPGRSTSRCSSSTGERRTRSRASSASRRRASRAESASRASCSSSRRAGNKTFDVLSAPGRATGWTAKTYPWAQDQPGSGQVEPLLLAVGRHRERALHVERVGVREELRLCRLGDVRAVAEAWPALHPDFKRPLKLAQPRPGARRMGRGARVRVRDVARREARRRRVGAAARRTCGPWSSSRPGGPRSRSAPRSSRLVGDTLRPQGYSKESFAGKTPHALDADRLKQITDFGRAGTRGARHSRAWRSASCRAARSSSRAASACASSASPRRSTRTRSSSSRRTRRRSRRCSSRRRSTRGSSTWDTPVTQVYPGFKLGDADTTQQGAHEAPHLRVHRPAAAGPGVALRVQERHAEERARARSATIQPTTKFGETFQYSNLLAGAAGFIGGARRLSRRRSSARRYDEAMQTRIFGPLGMKATTFDFGRALAGDHATPARPGRRRQDDASPRWT